MTIPLLPPVPGQTLIFLIEKIISNFDLSIVDSRDMVQATERHLEEYQWPSSIRKNGAFGPARGA